MQKTFFNSNTKEFQNEQAEEKPIFNYRCRPKTQPHPPFYRLGGN